MADERFIEKRCTCGKISWDNVTGNYNETHQVNDRGFGVRDIKCNTNGGTIIDGVEQS